MVVNFSVEILKQDKMGTTHVYCYGISTDGIQWKYLIAINKNMVKKYL